SGGVELRRQAERLLADPRAAAFTANFAGQWLGVRDVGVMQPDEAIYPDYDAELEDAIRREPLEFFQAVLDDDLSVLSFLDSDFVMLNERLARHYGIAGVTGGNFQRVRLNGTEHRGGILTQASMLSITSDGVRSSPVVRGVWILTNVLGQPPSPPPANVPDLEPDTRGTRTIRDELARHRNIASCNSCHHRIDPLGFALEHYDAVGAWRERYQLVETAEGKEDAKPKAKGKNKGKAKGKSKVAEPGRRGAMAGPLVDASGESAEIGKFRGADELKQRLLEHRELFVTCLARKLLTYATGRTMNASDEHAVAQLVKATAGQGFRFRELVLEVAVSEPFLTK
ncbi:MAG: DUF1588 domain-containing protein, partial [Planctomycetales bacterium]|nr:DUF1588 domain-containing protein [Planctomycetales bacterium]